MNWTTIILYYVAFKKYVGTLTRAKNQRKPHAVIVRPQSGWQIFLVVSHLLALRVVDEFAAQSLPRQVRGDGQLQAVRQEDAQGNHNFDNFRQSMTCDTQT